MIAAALVLAGIGAGHALSSPGRPVSLTAYVRQVHALTLELHRSQRPNATSLPKLESELQSLSSVRLPDGAVLSTDLPSIAASIVPADPRTLHRAAIRLDAIDRALRDTIAASANPSQLAQLDSVLRDPRFHPRLSPLDRFVLWIENLIARFLSLAPRPRAELNSGILVAFAAVVLLLVAAAGILLARGALARSAPAAESLFTDESATTSATAWQRSRALARSGAHREAFRFLFLATLLQLQEEGLLRLRRGDTNRELMSLLEIEGPGAESRRKALEALVNEFDRAWYGHLPFTEQDYDRCLQLSSNVLTPSSVLPEGLAAS